MEFWKDSRVLHVKSFDDMSVILKEKGRPLTDFKKGDTIHVWNKMQKGYTYVLKESPGEAFDPEFKPHASPGEILALGAFGGKYMNDCLLEFPAEWFWNAGLLGKLAPGAPPGGDVSLNYFKIDSRLPLSDWQAYGWVPSKQSKTLTPKATSLLQPRASGKRAVLSDPKRNPDERGWFQWYCRYWMGRRIPDLDAVQIQRWKNFARHRGAIEKNCVKGDLSCRPRQRQALLHWAWPYA